MSSSPLSLQPSSLPPRSFRSAAQKLQSGFGFAARSAGEPISLSVITVATNPQEITETERSAESARNYYGPSLHNLDPFLSLPLTLSQSTFAMRNVSEIIGSHLDLMPQPTEDAASAAAEDVFLSKLLTVAAAVLAEKKKKGSQPSSIWRSK